MSTNKNLITIGIPFYNDEKYLDLAIKSVFAQTYTDWKLILMDDGSTDKSLEIAKKYKDDHRVTIYSDGENRQLPFRLNQIASLTTTKYLARMDSDDIMHPERIQTQIKILEDNPEIDVLGTNALTIDQNNVIKGIKFIPSSKEYLFSTISFIHPSIMGKTSWFKNNTYNENAIRIEDGELWYRTRKNSSFYCLNVPLLFYREFGGNYYRQYRKGIKSFFKLSWHNFSHKEYRDSIAWLYKGVRYVIKYLSYLTLSKTNREQYLIDKRSVKITEKESVIYKNSLSFLFDNYEKKDYKIELLS